MSKKYFPNWFITIVGQDLYTMDYAGFAPVAIQAIKEQQEIIDELKTQSQNQNDIIQALQKRIDKLENLILQHED